MEYDRCFHEEKRAVDYAATLDNLTELRHFPKQLLAMSCDIHNSSATSRVCIAQARAVIKAAEQWLQNYNPVVYNDVPVREIRVRLNKPPQLDNLRENKPAHPSPKNSVDITALVEVAQPG